MAGRNGRHKGLAGKKLPLAAVALAAAVAAGVGSASVVIPPENLGELAKSSDIVVLAVADAAFADWRGSELITVTRFVVAETVSGFVEPGDVIEVVVPGGEGEDGTFLVIAGAPRFAPGVTYLLPLSAAHDGTWQPSMLAYGILEQANGVSETLLRPLREAASLDVWQRPDGTTAEGVGVYRKRELLDHLAEIAAGTSVWQREKVEAPPTEIGPAIDQAPPASCSFLMASNNKPMRWKTFDSGKTVSVTASKGGDPTVGGGGLGELQQALSDWTAVPGTAIKLRYQGEKSYTMSCGGSFDTPSSGTSIVVFSDPCRDLADLNNCSGLVAYGGAWGSGTHTYDGVTYNSISSLYVVVNNGISCLSSALLRAVLTHELGHGLGFGHSSDPDSVMYRYCGNSINETDTACAQYLYSATGPKPPAAPAAVSASDGTFSDHVGVSWSPAAGAGGYAVVRWPASDPADAVQFGPVTGTSWDDATAAPGIRYAYTVKAINVFGASSSPAPDEGYLGRQQTAENPFATGGLRHATSAVGRGALAE